LDFSPKAIGEFVLGMIAFLFSASVHESAHAWTSSYFGDDLARSQGRITLNPIVHIDPLGTLILPAIAFFTHVPILGWAKATPVNPLRWRNKRVANFWVSAAGVLCNFAMAIIAGIVIRLLWEFGVIHFGHGDAGLLVPASDSMIAIGAVSLLTTFFQLNVALAIFNLFPIPPLDGSGVLSSVLPSGFDTGIQQLHQFGWVLLFIAVFSGLVGKVILYFIVLAWSLLFLGAGVRIG